MILLLLACDPSVDTDAEDSGLPDDTDTATTETGDDSGTTQTGSDYTLAVATTSTDYMSGAFATWDAENGLQDEVLTLGSDVALRADGDTLYVLTRSTENTVRVYEGLDWSAPALEFSTGDDTNPHDVASCGGKLVVSLYDEGNLGVFDTSGNRVGTVDLSAYADADGSGEPDAMFVSPAGFLYVALNEFDYGVYTSTTGHLVKVDCAAWSVAGSWEVGANARIQEVPTEPDGLFVVTGNYYDPVDFSVALDGALRVFDTSTDAFTDFELTEEEVGYNIDGVTGSGDASVIMVNDGYSWFPYCFSDPDTRVEGPWMDKTVFSGSMVTGPDGLVWIAARAGYAKGPKVEGLVSIDPVTCAQVDLVQTAFPPSSVVLLP